MVELFQRGETFVARGMGLADVGRYVLLRLPPMIQQAVPLAALAGAMATFAAFGRSHEMTAIRAAGISQWRVLAMALPVPLLLSLASFVLAEQVVPTSQVRFAAWWSSGEPARKAPETQARWFRIGSEIVRAGRASADGSRLGDVRIFRRDGDGLLAERLSAGSATAEAGRWTLTGVDMTRVNSGQLERRRAASCALADAASAVRSRRLLHVGTDLVLDDGPTLARLYGAGQPERDLVRDAAPSFRG